MVSSCGAGGSQKASTRFPAVFPPAISEIRSPDERFLQKPLVLSTKELAIRTIPGRIPGLFESGAYRPPLAKAESSWIFAVRSLWASNRAIFAISAAFVEAS